MTFFASRIGNILSETTDHTRLATPNVRTLRPYVQALEYRRLLLLGTHVGYVPSGSAVELLGRSEVAAGIGAEIEQSVGRVFHREFLRGRELFEEPMIGLQRRLRGGTDRFLRVLIESDGFWLDEDLSRFAIEFFFSSDERWAAIVPPDRFEVTDLVDDRNGWFFDGGPRWLRVRPGASHGLPPGATEMRFWRGGTDEERPIPEDVWFDWAALEAQWWRDFPAGPGSEERLRLLQTRLDRGQSLIKQLVAGSSEGRSVQGFPNDLY